MCDSKTYTEDAGTEMVWIEPGSFLMGSPSNELGRDSDEGPQTQVTLDGFWLGKYEVTQAQYEAVMGSNPSHFGNNPQNPVDRVSWTEAQEFCRRLSNSTGQTYTLPTEAQWEYACRAGTVGRYSFDGRVSCLVDYAWFRDNSEKTTHPVGQKQPNAWGLYDIHGNVWEWCADWYGNSYRGGSLTNPTGASSGQYRVLRGGSWSSDPRDCRSAYRNSSTSDNRFNNLGFRLCCDVVGMED